MPSNDRVDVFHWVSAYDPSPLSGTRKIGLLHARMDGLQCSQERDKLRGEFLQGRYLRSEERVSSSSRLRQKEESGEARRLQFIRDVRVPYGRGDTVIDLEVEACIGVPGGVLSVSGGLIKCMEFLTDIRGGSRDSSEGAPMSDGYVGYKR